jgi:hypothetical protein
LRTSLELLVCHAASSVVFFGVELEKWLARRGWLYRERETPGIRATTGTMDQGGGRA